MPLQWGAEVRVRRLSLVLSVLFLLAIGCGWDDRDQAIDPFPSQEAPSSISVGQIALAGGLALIGCGFSFFVGKRIGESRQRPNLAKIEDLDPIRRTVKELSKEVEVYRDVVDKLKNEGPRPDSRVGTPGAADLKELLKEFRQELISEITKTIGLSNSQALSSIQEKMDNLARSVQEIATSTKSMATSLRNIDLIVRKLDRERESWGPQRASGVDTLLSRAPVRVDQPEGAYSGDFGRDSISIGGPDVPRQPEPPRLPPSRLLELGAEVWNSAQPLTATSTLDAARVLGVPLRVQVRPVDPDPSGGWQIRSDDRENTPKALLLHDPETGEAALLPTGIGKRYSPYQNDYELEGGMPTGNFSRLSKIAIGGVSEAGRYVTLSKGVMLE